MIRYWDNARKSLKISLKGGILFKLDLRGRINIIRGKSGTGKTLLYNLIDELLYSRDSTNSELVYGITLINAAEVQRRLRRRESMLSLTSGLKDNLIIIDNADNVFEDCPELVNAINEDYDNTYLIYMRGYADIRVSPNYVGELKRDANTVTMTYKHSVRGWY